MSTPPPPQPGPQQPPAQQPRQPQQQYQPQPQPQQQPPTAQQSQHAQPHPQQPPAQPGSQQPQYAPPSSQQPPYGQPLAQGYAQPIPPHAQQQPQYEQAAQYQQAAQYPSQAQYPPHAEQHPQQYAQQAQYASYGSQYPQAPSGALNALGLVALIITGAVALIWSIAAPFILQALYLRASYNYDTASMFLWDWLDVLVGVPLYLVALILAILGARSKTRPRGRFLAYIAIGGAGVGILATMVANIAARIAYGY